MSHLNTMDVIRAWKDPEYRLSLSEAERAQLPEHSAGVIELLEPELASIHGGSGCSWNAHTGSYIRDPINYPESDPSDEGICGVTMCCLEEENEPYPCGSNADGTVMMRGS